MRLNALIILIVLNMANPLLVQGSKSLTVYDFNVGSQRTIDALSELAAQADCQLLFAHEIVESKKSRPVIGRYDIATAVNILLEGTNLSGRLTEHGVILIKLKQKKSNRGDVSMKIKKNFLASVIGLFVGAGGVQQVAAQYEGQAQEDWPWIIEEIIVTATKRATNLQDTAVSIFVLDSDDIKRKSLVSMGDYLSTIPGVSQQDFGAGFSQIIVRGLSAGPGEAATTGVYFGEAPLPSIAELDGAVDLRLVDIERVEVLRGPQGTLYGSGSLGGTIRYIPTQPDLENVEGYLTAGYSNTANRGGNNYNVQGAINVPLIEERLALRMVAYRFDDSGYVDVVSASDPTKSATAAVLGAVVVDEKGVGDLETTGVRASLLWRPVNELEVSAMYVGQDIQQDGFQEVNLTLGGYQDTFFDLDGNFGGREFQTDDIELFNVVAEYDLGWASVLSASTWSEGSKDFTRDLGRVFGAPLPQELIYRKDGFSQEIRLASQFEGPLQFTGGVYYEDLTRDTDSHVNWSGSEATLPLAFEGVTDPTDLLFSELSWAVDQVAVFGEFAYDITEQVTATLGGRWFDYTREEDSFVDGPVNGEERTIQIGETTESGTNFKANLAYEPTKEILLYADWAEGFRIGAPGYNAPAAVCDVDNDGILDGTNAPNTADPLRSDETNSYEIGGKFFFFGGRMALNTAIYHVDWDGIPVAVISPCGFAVTLNAGQARTRGVEVDSSFYLASSLRVDVGVSYVDAELSEDDDVLGPAGTRLPGSSEFSANAGFEYEFSLAGNESFLRADYAYIGGYRNDIAATFPEAGDYGTLSMRAGTRINNIDVEIYGNNLTDSDAITFVDTLPTRGYRLRPRTVGLEVNIDF